MGHSEPRGMCCSSAMLRLTPSGSSGRALFCDQKLPMEDCRADAAGKHRSDVRDAARMGNGTPTPTPRPPMDDRNGMPAVLVRIDPITDVRTAGGFVGRGVRRDRRDRRDWPAALLFDLPCNMEAGATKSASNTPQHSAQYLSQGGPFNNLRESIRFHLARTRMRTIHPQGAHVWRTQRHQEGYTHSGV